MADKERALQLVQEFKSRGAQISAAHPCAKDGLWLSICRNKVADGLENRIYFPYNLNQKNTNICGVAAFVRQWIQDDPVGFATLGISLYEHGRGHLGKGKNPGREIKPSPELLASAVPSTPHAQYASYGVEMNHADWIVMASIREAFNSVFNYSENEGIFAIKAWNFPSEVVATFKEAGYSNIVNATEWAKPQGWESLMEASNKFNNKWRVVLLVNARILNDDQIGTEAFIATSDHWIGLQSIISLTSVGAESRVTPFKVFTWGSERKVPLHLPNVPLMKLLKNYYGYIAAKY